MRFLLLYPPDHRLGHSPYYSLPVLAGQLKRAGHEVRIRDVNAEAITLLLDDDILATYYDLAQERVEALSAKRSRTPAEEVQLNFVKSALRMPREMVIRGGTARRTMLDHSAFYDPAAFRESLTAATRSCEFLFSGFLGPSPYLDDFHAAMIRSIEGGIESPITMVYQHGLIDSLVAEQPDVIGLTMPFQEQIQEGFYLAHQLRQRLPNAKIIIGGPQVTKYRDQFFKNSSLFRFIDGAFMYDGDDPIVQYAEMVAGQRAIDQVNNLYWSSGGAVFCNGAPTPTPLNTIAPPSYDGVDFAHYLKPEPVYALETSRGCCWGKCTFCSEAFRDGFNMRSPEKVFEDIKHLVETYGARFLFFWDSLMPPKTMMIVADKIAEAGYDVHWWADTKFYNFYLKPEFCERLKKGGAAALHVGLESANQRVLDLQEKGTEIAKVPEMMRNIKNAGIIMQCSWFIGFPGETKAEMQETLAFIRDHRETLDLSIFCGSYYFELGTKVAMEPDRFGGHIEKLDGDYRYVPNGEEQGWLSDELRLSTEARYAEITDMDLMCHGGYVLHHVNRPGADLHLLSRSEYQAV